MKLFLPILSEQFKFFMPKHLDSFNQLVNSKKNTGLTLEADYLGNDDSAVSSDFTWVVNYTLLAANRKAREKLEARSIEFIPLKDNEEYSIIFTPFLDALDLKKCDIDYFPHSHRIMGINKYAFKENKIPENTLFFRVKKLDSSPVFVTENFVNFYNENNYTGYTFKSL